VKITFFDITVLKNSHYISTIPGCCLILKPLIANRGIGVKAESLYPERTVCPEPEALKG
jgi:hypothetical protein